MILVVNSTDAVTLKIDPSVVLATRKYVDDKVIEVKAYADSLMAAHLAAASPHPQYEIPVGIPLPWPTATPPAGWLKCNGAAFDKAKYPKLAAVYPLGLLPDLRGEFIRGWDDGRGVDAGRTILSNQGDAIRNITGMVSGTTGVSFDSFSGAFYDSGAKDANEPTTATKVNRNDDFYFDASRVVPTANENRPRSIAFNYIVRAA
jgi:phage-related tail fiber protein